MQALTQPQPLLPVALTKTAVAAVTTVGAGHSGVANGREMILMSTTTGILPIQQPVLLTSVPLNQIVAEKSETFKAEKQEDKVLSEPRADEKRPRTTEWEKFADMLAQTRKFNSHDVFRRGNTLTKFGSSGIGQLKERYMRNGMDEDSSDTTSNYRGSPLRSSAGAVGKVQRLANRPNTGHNRMNNYEFCSQNVGGHYVYKTHRISNKGSTAGRKFDFNPVRSRIDESVSSSSLLQSSSPTTAFTQINNAPYHHLNESVKSLANVRSHHSPPLATQERKRTSSKKESIPQTRHHHHLHQHQQHQHQQHPEQNYELYAFGLSGSRKASQSDPHNSKTLVLTRQPSNASLFSNTSYLDTLPTFKSSTLGLHLLPTSQPPARNTSSFLTTPRSSAFSLKKSYTDLYFSAPSSKENRPHAPSELCSKDKSPFKVRKNPHDK